MPKDELVLSTLNKTWIFDLDGTIVKHNGYKIDGEDSMLPGAKEYLDGIPADDRIIILTSRKMEYEAETVTFLARHGVRYDRILFEMPMGERIVVNDRKPSGLDMAVALNMDRDAFSLPGIIRER